MKSSTKSEELSFISSSFVDLILLACMIILIIRIIIIMDLIFEYDS